MLSFYATVECEECGEEYEGRWTDSSMDPQDVAEAPVADQTCPACDHVQAEEYPGWMFQSEAG